MRRKQKSPFALRMHQSQWKKHCQASARSSEHPEGGMPRAEEDESVSWYFPNYRICLAILSHVPCNIETHKFSSFGSLVGTASNYPCSLGMVENAFQTPNRDKIGRKSASVPFSLGLHKGRMQLPQYLLHICLSIALGSICRRLGATKPREMGNT